MPDRSPVERSSAILALASLFALLTAPAIAAPVISRDNLRSAAQLRDAALAGSGAYDIVSSLTTEVGPRLAGSPGDAAAVAWAQRKFRELGFDEVRLQEVMVPQWVRGAIDVRVVSPAPQPLAATALGGSVGTQDGGITAEVVEFKDIASLKAASPNDVAGRIVFVNQRMERTRDGRGYMRNYLVRADGASIAGSKGALAIVIRSVSTSTSRLPHTGRVTYAIGSPRIPAAALSNPDADQLERLLALGQPVRLVVTIGARDLPYVKSYNVIGEIRGSTKPEEIVLLGAHLDSWDLGTGAIDDGAGVAIVMAAARLVRQLGLRPQRSIRVVLFANEEFTLSGASAYANQTPEELARHVVALEADGGGGKVFRLNSRVTDEYLPVIDAVRDVLRPLELEPGDNNAMAGPDVQALLLQGVPVLWISQDTSQYFDSHHSANDTLDKLDPKLLDRAAAAYAVAAWIAAQSPNGLGRAPPRTPGESRPTAAPAAAGSR